MIFYTSMLGQQEFNAVEVNNKLKYLDILEYLNAQIILKLFVKLKEIA